MSMESLADAFHNELRDILSAERQIAAALPKMAKSASDLHLQQALQAHLDETEGHIERVEQAFEETGKAPRAKTCEAMKGLIEEAEELINKEEASSALDAMLIAEAQKVEHYEIAVYGTLCTWAEALGYTKALDLLKQNIDEEKMTDEKLSSIAESINHEALATA